MMDEELFNFIYGIEEKETPNLDQVDESYFTLRGKISKVLMILYGIIFAIIYSLLFIMSISKRITQPQVIIYSILSCCVMCFINAPFCLIFRFDKIIYPYMVKKNPKAYMENQNLLPDYYYIMGWVKLKKEVRK